ncbi:unnamed protein product, partial [Amoebophrya sp. A120]|eukprot:GSA120T00001534001.1
MAGTPDTDAPLVAQVECGANHVLLLSDDGLIYSWGSQEQIGRGNAGLNDFDPKPGLINTIRKDAKMLHCIQIACGTDHSLALTADGQVFAWGKGKSGQLGVPLTHFDKAQFVVRNPELLSPSFFGGEAVQRIAANGRSSCATTVSGRLFVWGEAAATIYGSRNAFVPQEVGGAANAGAA